MRKHILLGAAVIFFMLTSFGAYGASKSSDRATVATTAGKLDRTVTLRVLEAGGISGKAMQKAYLDPFTAKTGIKVTRDSPTTFGQLQAQVKSGKITHNLVELDSISAKAANALGLVEKLDYRAIKPAAIDSVAKLPYALGVSYYSTIMSWRRSDAVGRGPQSWADFWNTERFPGKRALSDFPSFTLPIALLADGVKPQNLYPLDIDRAFRSLDKIKNDIAVLWTAGSQPGQLLSDGEVDYVMAWSGRIVNNPKFAYTFNQGLLDISYLVMPKGAPDKAETFALLRQFTLLRNQLTALRIIPYTGTAKGLALRLPANLASKVPTSAQNRKKQVLQNAAWWVANYAKVEKRWQAWKLTL